MTVHYEDDYSIHFTASDPEGDHLTAVTQPVNEDWIGCDGGPATDFTCEYSSSRYYDAAPLPAEPFQRTVSYSVTDGTTTTTGVWTVHRGATSDHGDHRPTDGHRRWRGGAAAQPVVEPVRFAALPGARLGSRHGRRRGDLADRRS